MAHPTSFDCSGDLPFDAPGPVEWYAGRHGAEDDDDSTTFILTRMWEMWRPADRVELPLVETWRTAPFSGSDNAQIADRPGYVADTDHHLGWLLELTEAGLPTADPSPLERMTLRPAQTGGGSVTLPRRVQIQERTEDVLREL